MTKSSAKYITIVGMALQILTLLGVVLTVAALLRTFSSIAAEAEVAGGAARLSEGVSEALSAMIATRPYGLAGLVLMAIGIGLGRFRERWVFRWACICMIPWILSIGVGTVIGLAGLVLLVVKRKEFGDAEPVAHPACRYNAG